MAPASPTSNVSSCGTKLDHLQCNLQLATADQRYFHLNLLLALDHPLPGRHLADVHQGAVGQQGTQLADKRKEYSWVGAFENNILQKCL